MPGLIQLPPTAPPSGGGKAYRACVACHTLEPGLHLSSPSLAGIIGPMAGTAEGYERYSQGAQGGGLRMERRCTQWLAGNPSAMIPDTYMVFEGIREAAVLADLIAFPQIAGKAGGGMQAVADGLIPAGWLRGAAPDPIRDAPPEARVTESGIAATAPSSRRRRERLPLSGKRMSASRSIASKPIGGLIKYLRSCEAS